MEHIYKHRRLYGLDILGSSANFRPMMPVQEDKIEVPNFKMLEMETGMQPDDYYRFSVLWIIRSCYKNCSMVANMFLQSVKDIGEEIVNGGITLASIKRNIMTFSPTNFIHNIFDPVYLDYLKLKKWFRPIIHGIKVVRRNLSVVDHILLALLFSTTSYFLWKTQAYIRHSRKNEVDIEGKVVLITGATSGIGERLVYEFIQRKAIVIMASPDLTRILQVADNVHRYFAVIHGTNEYSAIHVKKSDPQEFREWEFFPEPLDYLEPMPHLQPEEPYYVKNLWVEMDLGDIQSIWRTVYNIFENFKTVDILINNAGVNFPPDVGCITFDGFEANFGINYMGHFILTNLIIGYLETSEDPCRIINVTCEKAFSTGLLTMKDMGMLRKSEMFLENSYDTSKFCNYLFTLELTKRLKTSDLSCINTYAVCPPVCKTNLDRYMEESISDNLAFKCSPNAGIQTILHCALSPSCATESGQFYEHCDRSISPLPRGKFYKDLDKICETLWDISVQKSKSIIDKLKEKDMPLRAANFYGNAVFRTDRITDPEFVREYRPNPVRKLLEFRHFYKPIYFSDLYLDQVKEELCEKDLVDVWLDIHGDQVTNFGNKSDSEESNPFDPIYDKQPILIHTKNNWIYT